MKKSLIRDLLILALIVAVFIVFFDRFFPEVIHRFIWITYSFLLLLSLLSLAILGKIQRDFPGIFSNAYLGIMVGRLFIMAGFAGIIVYFDKAHAMLFSINFLILYLLFHGFEIKGIISNLRHQFKKGKRDDQ